jgi:hypothetical protein
MKRGLSLDFSRRLGVLEAYLQVREELEMIVVVGRDESFESFTKICRFLRKMLLWSERFLKKGADFLRSF